MRTHVRSGMGSALSGFIRRIENFVLAAVVAGLLTSAGTVIETVNQALFSIKQLAPDITRNPVIPKQHDAEPSTYRHDPSVNEAGLHAEAWRVADGPSFSVRNASWHRPGPRAVIWTFEGGPYPVIIRQITPAQAGASLSGSALSAQVRTR